MAPMIDDHARIGDWMQVQSGLPFWPLDPRPHEIDIVDIAHSLSMQCRYGGHVKQFYSIAEHCCLIHDALPDAYKFEGLMHDATEAYCVDVPRPVKRSLANYKAIEDRLWAVIAECFSLPAVLSSIVKDYDNRILMNERDQAMNPYRKDWGLQLEPLPNVIIQFWSPKQAKHEFLTRFVRHYEALLGIATVGIV